MPVLDPPTADEVGALRRWDPRGWFLALRVDPRAEAESAVPERSAGDDHARGIGAAADSVGEADSRAVDLSGPGVAPHLVHELDDLAERRRAQRFTLRQQTAARVHRPMPPGVGEELRLLAGRAELELLVGEQLAGGVGVLALDHVEVVGADAGFRVRVVARRGSTGA